MYRISYTNIHHDVTDLVNHGIITNAKTCALRDLVPFVQFKKREKHRRRSVTFSKLWAESSDFAKSKLVHECFSRFLNCKNGTKLHKASHILKVDLNFSTK